MQIDAKYFFNFIHHFHYLWLWHWGKKVPKKHIFKKNIPFYFIQNIFQTKIYFGKMK